MRTLFGLLFYICRKKLFPMPKTAKNILVFLSFIILFYGLTAFFSEPFVDLPDRASDNSFVVLELFTSQGCSSCPAADKQLRTVKRIAEQKKLPVYALSFHVDYWDRLGWKDTYSSTINTQRQYEYARVFSKRNVYTPQMIVNGTYEFVGSDQLTCNKYIAKELKKPIEENIHLSASYTLLNDLININYKTGNIFDGFLNIAIVQSEGEVNIRRGENSGRKIAYSNIVRAFKQVNCNNKCQGKWLTKIPRNLNAEDILIYIYLQNRDDMRIMAATRAVVK